MKEEFTDKAYNVLVPFLAGGLVGAGIMLLFAPKSGKEVRKDIKRFTHDSKERVTEVLDKGKELYKDSIERATKTIDKGKDIYERGQALVGKAVEAGKTAFS
ncbi:MAG TPA: YtxH domain-containing protein [Nitrospirota bacterium]|nr:YtxH domain-containing protein [Nitrospirota bacterium]